MGLDTVELLMDVEDKFQIQFTDCEAEKINTVGDFYNAILSKIELKPMKECKSQKLFYRLRKTFSIYTGVSSKEIFPKTKIQDLMPKNERKEFWSNFQNSFGFKTPDLERPKLIEKFLSYFGGFGFLIGLIATFIVVLKLTLFPLIIPLLLSVVYYAVLLVSKPMKIYPYLSDMRELTEAVLSLNIETFQLSKENKNEVLLLLKGIFHDR